MRHSRLLLSSAAQASRGACEQSVGDQLSVEGQLSLYPLGQSSRTMDAAFGAGLFGSSSRPVRQRLQAPLHLADDGAVVTLISGLPAKGSDQPLLRRPSPCLRRGPSSPLIAVSQPYISDAGCAVLSSRRRLPIYLAGCQCVTFWPWVKCSPAAVRRWDRGTVSGQCWTSPLTAA